MRRAIVFTALLASTSAFTAACLLAKSDCTFDGSCVGASSGNLPDSDGPDVGTDPCIDTPTDATCLDETKALFVSGAAGDDGAEGTRAKPFKTIGAALGRVDASRRRIYVCAGTYAEDVALTSAHAGVSLFGGINCDWSPAPDVKPVIGATANPMKISDAQGVSLAQIAVEAKDASSGSSIGIFVSGATATLKNVRVAAGGVAAKGAAGVLKPFEFPSPEDLKGNDAPDKNTGGPAKPYTCPGDKVTKGGAGGNFGIVGNQGEPGPPNGGTFSDCTSGGTGKIGVGGDVGPLAGGAEAVGSLDEGGWVPAAGGTGGVGSPGQGGGGGTGAMGGGGSGGAGACGGAGGGGGHGGDASVAVAALSAELKIIASTLVAKRAGDGGDGVVGQVGQTEVGTRGVGSGSACNGGNGGPGGNGGSGGGGAGGISVGVLYKSSTIDVDSDTRGQTTVGAIAKGGKGGDGDANKGIDGVSERVFESPN